MSTVLHPGPDFDFSTMRLTQPRAMQGGGVYMTEVVFGHDVGEEAWIQLPRCKTKQGIVINGRKGHCDLVYPSSDTIVYEWIERLQEQCQRLIYARRDEWFHNPLSMDDIESAFVSVTKLYRSGKAFLARIHVRSATGESAPLAFDHNRATIALSDISADRTIIPMIKVGCIKFSSRSFALELVLQQAMVLEDRPPIRDCRIELKSGGQSEERRQETATVKENTEVDNLEHADDVASESLEIPVVKHVSDDDPTPSENETHVEMSAEATETTSEIEKNTKDADEVKNVVMEDIVVVEDTVPDGLIEVEDITLGEDESSSMRLRKPNEVYLQVYQAAKAKAKLARKAAIEALLEARKIKNTYLLDDVEDSSSDDEAGEALGIDS